MWWSKAARFSACQCNALKHKSCHDANFVVTSGTVGCRYDNLRCHKWRQSWHHITRVFQGGIFQHSHIQLLTSTPHAILQQDGALHTGVTSSFGHLPSQGTVRACLAEIGLIWATSKQRAQLKFIFIIWRDRTCIGQNYGATRAISEPQ